MSLLPLHIIRPAPPAVDLALIANAATLPFDLKRSKSVTQANSLIDLDIDDLRHHGLYRAIILNLLGPVISSFNEKPSAAILEKLQEIHRKMLLCLLPEKNQPIPEEILRMGIPIAHGFVPKSDSRGYNAISEIYIQNRNTETTMIPFKDHLVVGSNYLTDLNCKDAGMDYAYIRPTERMGSALYKLLCSYGEKVVRVHDLIRLLRGIIAKKRHHGRQPSENPLVNTTYNQLPPYPKDFYPPPLTLTKR